MSAARLWIAAPQERLATTAPGRSEGTFPSELRRWLPAGELGYLALRVRIAHRGGGPEHLLGVLHLTDRGHRAGNLHNPNGLGGLRVWRGRRLDAQRRSRRDGLRHLPCWRSCMVRRRLVRRCGRCGGEIPWRRLKHIAKPLADDKRLNGSIGNKVSRHRRRPSVCDPRDGGGDVGARGKLRQGDVWTPFRQLSRAGRSRRAASPRSRPLLLRKHGPYHQAGDEQRRGANGHPAA